MPVLSRPALQGTSSSISALTAAPNRTAFHMHLDTDDLLVLVEATHFGRILHMEKKQENFQPPEKRSQKLSLGKFLSG